MYIIARMRGWAARAAVIGLAAIAACSNPLGRQYEYEEQLYLAVDGAATVVVDASLAALVALRGVALDTAPNARIDRADIRRLFEAAACPVQNVGQPWRRKGRRFIQVRLATDDVRTLSKCGLLSWSSYELKPVDQELHYRQVVGAPAVREPGSVNWDGSELVAFKLHLPSRVRFHNVRRLEDGRTGSVERGNILTWEQRLADRRAGAAVEMDVKMDATSILNTTLWLFGGAFAAAVITLILIVWWTMRRGRQRIKSAT